MIRDNRINHTNRLKFRMFTNPRWQTTIILKSAYLCNAHVTLFKI